MNPIIPFIIGVIIITVTNTLNNTFKWMPQESILPYQLWVMAICIFMMILPTKIGLTYGL
tara:strand:+ start:15174 stop:15353 length:180 start_codon:yes stop_codon:yes gene_type:complete